MAENQSLFDMLDQLNDEIEDHINKCVHGKDDHRWDEIRFYRNEVFIDGVAWVIDWNTSFHPTINYECGCTWWGCDFKIFAQIKLFDIKGAITGYELIEDAQVVGEEE